MYYFMGKFSNCPWLSTCIWCIIFSYPKTFTRHNKISCFATLYLIPPMVYPPTQEPEDSSMGMMESGRRSCGSKMAANPTTSPWAAMFTDTPRVTKHWNGVRLHWLGFSEQCYCVRPLHICFCLNSSVTHYSILGHLLTLRVVSGFFMRI